MRGLRAGGRTVLDLGCGAGYVTVCLLEPTEPHGKKGEFYCMCVILNKIHGYRFRLG